MKTAEQKVNEFLKRHVRSFTNKQERELIILLKEQDRDTRHACAEAVINSEDPHSACMNVKAV